MSLCVVLAQTLTDCTCPTDQSRLSHPPTTPPPPQTTPQTDGHFLAALAALPPNLDWHRFLKAYKVELAKRRAVPMTKAEQSPAYKVYQALRKRDGPLRAPTAAFVAAVRANLGLGGEEAGH